MKELKVKIAFTQELLGTQTGDKEVYRSFIGSKAPDAAKLEEEVANLGADDVVDKGKTFFPRVNDIPVIYDYQIRGFFKEACKALSKVTGTKSSGLKAYKQQIDLRIFVKDRNNFLKDFDEVREFQRPIRCQTMQGERVSLAISEMLPIGTTCEFTVQCLVDSDIALVKEWLDYGAFHGFLQFRNGGFGKFTWEEIK
jgi:hypothetical protein